MIFSVYSILICIVVGTIFGMLLALLLTFGRMDTFTLIFCLFLGIVISFYGSFTLIESAVSVNKDTKIVSQNEKYSVSFLPAQIGDINTHTYIVNEKQFDAHSTKDTILKKDSSDSPYIIVDKVIKDYSKMWYVSIKWKENHREESYVIKEIHY